MRTLFLLLALSSFQLFAADEKGDGKITKHDGTVIQVFKTAPMSVLEKRRVHLRRDILSRVCSLSFWIGRATGMERCLAVVAKQEPAVANDPNHKVDLNKIVSEIVAIRDNLDELQDKDNPNLSNALLGLSTWAQSEIAVINSINIEELEAAGNADYATYALNMKEIEVLEQIKVAMTGAHKGHIPKEAREAFAKDEARIKTLTEENAALKAKFLELAKTRPEPSKVEDTKPAPAKEETPEEAARRIIGGY